ncbi:MAG TPA: MFS transporter [Streptosporangiaceae bacterium]|nr:MFS transporter [Streptosporangiaceae bacterium]
MSGSWLRMDLSPLAGRDFRVLFGSGTVTLLGTEATDVALVIQVKQLTGSTLAVGLLGAAELVPLVVFALYGGVLADRLDRRRVIRWCEAALGGCALLLLADSLLSRPLLWPLYAVVAAMNALAALQRPSVEASIPRVVPPGQLTAAVTLLSGTQNLSVIAGSSLGGVLAAGAGPAVVYGLDAVSFVISFGLLLLLHPIPAAVPAEGAGDGPAEGAEGAGEHPGEHPPAAGLRSVLAGLRYARGRPELLGSYLADLAAMTMSYPAALFPFLAASLHANWAVGLMFACPSIGAFLVTVPSGWMTRVRRHGLAIALAACAWGLAIVAFGLAPDIAVALATLVLAGGADMVSGIFRDLLWKQTIPDALRGRLAGVELLSYAVGPSAGQLRAGVVAKLTSTRFSLASGGVLCIGAVGLVCLGLPGFTRYQAPPNPGDRSE